MMVVMTGPIHLAFSAALALSLGGAMSASGQVQYGTPVDRNVADTGANATSQRLAQPGIGQFGVGSLLLDRYGDKPYEPTQYDPYAGDPRVSQRYLLQAPGITALLDRPDYIGLSPQGGWVFNEQTLDGTELITLTPANTVYILSPELLQPNQPTPIAPNSGGIDDNPYRVLPQTQNDPYALMRDTQIDRRAYAPNPGAGALEPENNYRHPEIIERERKLKEEREREAAAAAEQAAPSQQAQQAPSTPVDGDKKPDESDPNPANHEDAKNTK